MTAISITMDSMFPLKVLVINKNKDTHLIAHFRLQSFSLDLIPCFWPFFFDFQNQTVSLCVNNLINEDVK